MERLIGLLGMTVLLGLGWLLSKHKRSVNLRTVAATTLANLMSAAIAGLFIAG